MMVPTSSGRKMSEPHWPIESSSSRPIWVPVWKHPFSDDTKEMTTLEVGLWSPQVRMNVPYHIHLHTDTWPHMHTPMHSVASQSSESSHVPQRQSAMSVHDSKGPVWQSKLWRNLYTKHRRLNPEGMQRGQKTKELHEECFLQWRLQHYGNMLSTWQAVKKSYPWSGPVWWL